MEDLLEKFRTDPNSGEEGGIKQNDPQEKGVDFESIGEDQIFSFLSKKTNREIKSWEDVVLKEKVEVAAAYASPEAESFDKYARETGRTLKDYMNLHQNWDDIPDEKIARDYLRKEHPELETEEEVSAFMSIHLGKQEVDPDEMSEREVADIERRNKSVDLEMKRLVHAGRNYFKSEQEKYKMPSERQSDIVSQGQEIWKESMSKTLGELNSIEDGDFKYSLKDKKEFEHVTGLQSILDSFKKEDGTMDYGSLVKTLVIGRKFPDILKEHAGFVEANTRSKVMAEYSEKGEFGRHTDGSFDRGEWEKKNREIILKGI
jgi:hypothetical protein